MQAQGRELRLGRPDRPIAVAPTSSGRSRLPAYRREPVATQNSAVKAVHVAARKSCSNLRGAPEKTTSGLAEPGAVTSAVSRQL